jgi:hypothetical protein
MADPIAKKGPDTPSSDYEAMAPLWAMVNAIMGGTTAMRQAKKAYLPQYANESDDDYTIRLAKAPFTNIYADIARNLASKPFSKEVALVDGSPPSTTGLIENIDGQGNNLHVFARETFQSGINKGIDWIVVDYPKVPPGATLADERALRARPYWVRVPAERMLAVYSDHVRDREIFIHARIYEPRVERVGWDERVVERVRVFDRAKFQTVDAAGNPGVDYGPATTTIWEKQRPAPDKEPEWVEVEGPLPISIGEIPLVPFVTGERGGAGWTVTPPLRDIAYAQVYEYQQESNLSNILDLTAYPMLAGNGIAPPVDERGAKIKVPVGPRAVLFAPPNTNGPHGEWKWIEPTADSIQKLMDHLETTRKEMRDLGMQPLLPKTGNLTATASAIAGAKAHSAVQSWALALKDALERAFEVSAKWLQEKVPTEVAVHTDFGPGIEVPTELATLVDMRRNGDLSQPTLWDEMKRRGVLSDDFDADAEVEAINKAPPPADSKVIDVQIPRA